MVTPESESTKVGFFEEAPYEYSMIRLMSFVVLVFMMLFDVFYIWIILEYRNRAVQAGAIVMPAPLLDIYFVLFNLVLLIAAFVPKTLQKFAEMREYLPESIQKFIKTNITASTEARQPSNQEEVTG